MKKNVFYLLALMLLISVNSFGLNWKIYSHADVTRILDGYITAPPTYQTPLDTLIISGSDVTQGDLNALNARVSAVNKYLLFENLTLPVPSQGATDNDGVGSLESFLGSVSLNGSIILRNSNINWMGKGLLPPHVQGDLILDNIPIPYPGVDNWAAITSFGNIQQVDGDYIINATAPLQAFNDSSFLQLKSVGGSFRILVANTVERGTWNMPAPKLTFIGGDFEINGPEYFDDGTPYKFQLWALDILQSIEHIGGDVTILNSVRLPKEGGWGSDVPNVNDPDFQEGTGYCYLRYLVDAGIIDYYNCKNVTFGMSDNLYDLSTIGACFYDDCYNMDTPSVPERSPDCATGIPVVKTTPAAFATVQPTYVKDDLNITSTANLAKVDVISLTGQTVKSFTAFTDGQNSFPVSNLTNGIYLVRLVSANNEVQTVKIIKQ